MNINPRTAVYIIKKNNKPVYIGKSMDPYSRWLTHHPYFEEEAVMEIIDEYNDPEIEWIEKFKQQGIILENISTNKSYTNRWKVGDVYTKPLSKGRPAKIAVFI